MRQASYGLSIKAMAIELFFKHVESFRFPFNFSHNLFFIGKDTFCQVFIIHMSSILYLIYEGALFFPWVFLTSQTFLLEIRCFFLHFGPEVTLLVDPSIKAYVDHSIIFCVDPLKFGFYLLLSPNILPTLHLTYNGTTLP